MERHFGEGGSMGAGLVASEYLWRALMFGIRDISNVPFQEGVVLGEVPHSAEYRVFAEEGLRNGCWDRVFESVSQEKVGVVLGREDGVIGVNRLVGEETRGREFRGEPSSAENALAKGSVIMETMQGFAMKMRKEDMLMSWDVKSWYRHFHLHPDFRDYFLFRYGGRNYRCVALPFGWGR